MSEWLTVQETARLLRVHRTTIYKLFRMGKLSYSEIEGLEGRRIRRSDVEQLLRPPSDREAPERPKQES